MSTQASQVKEVKATMELAVSQLKKIAVAFEAAEQPEREAIEREVENELNGVESSLHAEFEKLA